MTLGEVVSVYDGTHQTPKYTKQGVRFVSVEDIAHLSRSNKYIAVEDYLRDYKKPPAKGDLLMTRIGTIGKCAIVASEEPLAYYVSLCLMKPNSREILSGYLKHVLESACGRRELYKRTIHTAVPVKINLGDISKLVIPVPPLAEQQRIVDILDRFDSLTTSLTDGLPAEIEARRKQYEYYRDKLLTFKEKVA